MVSNVAALLPLHESGSPGCLAKLARYFDAVDEELAALHCDASVAVAAEMRSQSRSRLRKLMLAYADEPVDVTAGMDGADADVQDMGSRRGEAPVPARSAPRGPSEMIELAPVDSACSLDVSA